MARVQRWMSVTDVPAGHGPSVVVIGNFDGVHRGHRDLLAAVIAQARTRHAAAVAVTFDPHPAHVMDRATAAPLLTGLQQRLDLLEEVGLDAVLVLPYTERTPQWPAEDFVTEVLVDALGAVAVVAGRDVRFGTHGDGTPSGLSTLAALGADLGFEVVVLEDVAGPGQGGDGARRWSSSWARDLLAEGDVIHAAEVLGRPHRVAGTVVHGDHRGRELGYPTANLGAPVEGMVPADGVYAGWLVRLDAPAGAPDRLLPAAVSIGTNPTFDPGTRRRVEAYVLDRDDLDLYGERIGLDLVRRLRETVRFDGVDALCAQMAQDVATCREVLSALVPD